MLREETPSPEALQGTSAGPTKATGGEAMPLPDELWDEIVPETTTVVGDVDAFCLYVESGSAWQDWCARVHHGVRWMAQDFGPVSPDMVQQLVQRPAR